MSKISRQELDDHLDRDWEESFGVDYPGFLPYWVAYMDFDSRNRYLVAVRNEVHDFVPEMLNKDFDWANWDAITPQLGHPNC